LVDRDDDGAIGVGVKFFQRARDELLGVRSGDDDGEAIGDAGQLQRGGDALARGEHGDPLAVAVDVRVRNPGDLDDVTSAVAALPEVDRCAIRRTPHYRTASTNGQP
jgi:hypothetical protein